jgi:hypothetical protein
MTVGGSWDSEDYFLQLGYYHGSYTDTFIRYVPANGSYRYIFEKQIGPMPTLGFRVVMEILKD